MTDRPMTRNERMRTIYEYRNRALKTLLREDLQQVFQASLGYAPPERTDDTRAQLLNGWNEDIATHVHLMIMRRTVSEPIARPS